MDTTTIIALASAFGIGNLVLLVVGKIFSRKVDNIALIQQQVAIYQSLIEDLKKKLDTYIRLEEKSMIDIAVLQTQLRKMYPITCTVDNCALRRLVPPQDFAVNLTINDSDNV